jgi:hypothetical protein
MNEWNLSPCFGNKLTVSLPAIPLCSGTHISLSHNFDVSYNETNFPCISLDLAVLPNQHGIRRTTFQAFGVLGNVNSTVAKSRLTDYMAAMVMVDWE